MMSDTTTIKLEKIKIKRIKKVKKSSDYYYGYYIVATIYDEDRKITAMGRWVEKWEKGDVVEGNLKKRTRVDDNGSEHNSYYLENPHKKTFVKNY